MQFGLVRMKAVDKNESYALIFQSTTVKGKYFEQSQAHIQTYDRTNYKNGKSRWNIKKHTPQMSTFLQISPITEAFRSQSMQKLQNIQYRKHACIKQGAKLSGKDVFLFSNLKSNIKEKHM